jgi:gluconolactonase
MPMKTTIHPLRDLARSSLVALATVGLACSAWAQENAMRDVTLHAVADGFRFTEGPVFAPDGRLIFSDIVAEREYVHTPGGDTEVMRDGSFGANGHDFDPQGRLLTCEGEAHRVTRLEPDGRYTVLADQFEGTRLNAPNDLVAHRNGTIFFTDPSYGYPAGDDRQFIYRIDPDGQLHRVCERSYNKPNGIGLSPDHDTLYVNICSDHHVLAWRLDDDARPVGEPRRIIDGLDRGPDGMTVHPRSGDLFIALFRNNRGKNDEQGINVFSPDGKYKGLIPVPGTTTNCIFAPDGDSLYITSGGAVYRADLGADYHGQPVRLVDQP